MSYEQVQKRLANNKPEDEDTLDMPWESQWIEIFDGPKPSCGLVTRERFFPRLQPNYLAHGSYGAASLPALMEANEWNWIMEQNPAKFYYEILYNRIVRSTKHLAQFLNVNPESISLVRNVEIGIQAVLRSLQIPPGKLIICFDITYDAVKTSLKAISSERKLQLISVTLPDIITKESIIEAFVDMVDKYGVDSIELACLEHISSPTAIQFPIEDLIRICKSRGIKTLIDGAHAIGQIKLDLSLLQPDFYTSNLHKWFCSKRGCAFLYVAEEFRAQISPLLISWGWQEPFNSKFIWQGTDDYSAYLSIPTMIRFYNWYDWVDRNHHLAIWAGKMLSHVWATEQLVHENLCASMVCVRLPLSCSDLSVVDCFTRLKNHWRIEVPTFLFRGQRWVRISIHIYNFEDECLRFAKAVLWEFGYRDVLHFKKANLGKL
jgi:isopenicillin-N epimerase